MAHFSDDADEMVNCPRCGDTVKRSWLRPIPAGGGVFDGPGSPQGSSSFAAEMSDLPPEELHALTGFACVSCLGEPTDDAVDPSAAN